MEVGRLGRAAVAAAVFFIALDGGAYTLSARHTLAVGVWWLVACAVAFGLGEAKRFASGAGATLVAALCFAAVVGASVAWSADAEGAFREFDRVLLYIGVGILAALTPRRRVVVWTDGCAIGIALVALLALTSRFFPSVVEGHDLPQFLPGAAERLSYPLDYWNGLAVLLAMGAALVLRAAAVGSPVGRATAAGALPAIVCAIYLTASRTGAVVLLLAAAVFVALAADRWSALTTTLLAALASAAAVGVLVDRPALANGPTSGTGGRSAAVLILAICIAAGLANLLLAKRLPRIAPVRPAAAAAVGSAVLVGFLLLIVHAHPRARLAAFTRPPTLATVSQPNFVESHLLSAEGGGRWQFWQAALRQFEHRPLAGTGAGSYEAWWAQHGSLPVFVRYAHSLYLETLGELGLVGLISLLAVLACALASGAAALARGRGPERTTVAAVIAAASAYLVAAAVDWMWQLTAVSVVGVACLGLLVASGAPPAKRRVRGAGRVLVRGLLVFTALLAIACEGLPLLTDAQVRASQAAVVSGDSEAAAAHARKAVALQPWAASPYVQLALVDEQNQDLRAAAAAMRAALRRDPSDWRSWLIDARIETKRGEIGVATRSLKRAAMLNPRSPVFAP
jgi:O-antigen ligase/polysaccharide polymerase Wzy-like membrane protein